MLNLNDFPALRVHPSDRVTGILCSHEIESGGKFAVVTLSDGRYIAVWDGRYVTCATVEDLLTNLNGFERELLQKGMGYGKTSQNQSRPSDV